MSVIAMGAFADIFILTEKEQTQITNEADDWIDDMPIGMQDRLSDAVYHAIRGFEQEANHFRNMADTAGIGKYKVRVSDLKGGVSNDIGMRYYKPESTTRGILPLLIYFHGGGWSLGSLASVDKFCRALVSAGNISIVSIDYPMSPEHPWPNAITACKNAVEYIHTNLASFHSSENLISLGGDGAGGNIALQVYENLPENIKIRSLVLYYPLLSMKEGEIDPQSKRAYGRGFGLDSRLWESFISAYNGKEIEWKKTLVPTLLISAGRDMIIEENRQLSKSFNPVKYVEFTGAVHGFITDGHQKTAFEKAVALTNSFLK